MKKICLVIITSLCINYMLLAQVINYNYSNKEIIPNNEKIKPQEFGTFIQVKVDNINKAAHTINISGRKIEYTTNMPVELQRLFRVSVASIDTETKKADDGVKKINEALEDMNNLQRLATTPQTLKNEMNNEVLPKCNEYKTATIELISKLKEIKKAKRELIRLSKLDLTKDEMKEKLKLNGINEDLFDSLNKKIKNFDNIYLEVEVSYENALEKANAKEDSSKVIKALEKIEKGHDKIKSEDFSLLNEEVEALYKQLSSASNFSITSPPIQVEGDVIEYTITIDGNKEGVYKVPVKGGFKTDFSVGPTLSFGYNSKDEKPFLMKSKSNLVDSLNSGINRGILCPSLSIAAMMHCYYRSGTNFACGGMFGVGAGFQTINDVNLSIFLGGSIIIGQSKKTIVSAGLSYLKLNRLIMPEYKVGNIYKEKLDLASTVEKVFLPSFFVGVSYNLTNQEEIK